MSQLPPDAHTGQPPSPLPRRPFPQHIYFQTTEFTCGPATLMMAMAALDPGYALSRLEELRIWRRSTLVFHDAPPAGCSHYGLARSALQRGFAVEIFEHKFENLYDHTVDTREDLQAQRLLLAHDRDSALKAGATITQHKLDHALIDSLIEGGKMIIVLASYPGVDGHWVMIHDLAGDHLFIIDPYKGDKLAPYPVKDIHTGRHMIHYESFREWMKFGPAKGSVVLAISREKA